MIHESTEENGICDLQDALERLVCKTGIGILASCRKIEDGDENALTFEEARPLDRYDIKVRRASGAGRIIAKALLARAGAGKINDLLRSEAGFPLWPNGFVGSISHDPEFAVAAVARDTQIKSIGIDLESNVPISHDALNIVTTKSERLQIGGDLLIAKYLFSMKEAVYKALYMIDYKFLEFKDVNIDIERCVAYTNDGRLITVILEICPRIVSMAIIN